MKLSDWADVAVIVASLSVVVGMFQYFSITYTRRNDFEMMYINRLWVILDKLEDSRASNDEEAYERNLISYIILTNDQIELRSLGRIGNKTWKYWSRDIYRYCNSESRVKEVVNEKPVEFRFLSELLKMGENYDPLPKIYRALMFFA